MLLRDRPRAHRADPASEPEVMIMMMMIMMMMVMYVCMYVGT